MDSLAFREKFAKLIGRMAASADRKLTPEQADAYWRGLSHFPMEALGLAVDNLIRETKSGPDGFRHLPAVGDIIAEIRAMKADKASKVIPAYCSKCANSGLVLLQSSKGQGTAYRCDCPNGDRQDRSIKTWAEVREHYEPPEDPPIPDLQSMTVESIAALTDRERLEQGCEVHKMCDTCKKPYSVRHDYPISGKDLKEIHLRTALCEPCFIELGRRRGVWTQKENT